MIRRLLLLLTALSVFFLTPAAAEETGETVETPVGLGIIWANHLKPMSANGLGVGPDERLPVFLAPFEDAARTGGTVCAADSVVVLAAAGEWRMVRYAGGTGWILTPGAAEQEDDFPRDAKPLRVLRDAELTDDPWDSRRTVAVLSAGASVTGLCCFDIKHDWSAEPLYVQTELNGKTAWLFIARDDVGEISMTSREGDTLTIREGVTRIGDSFLGWLEGEEEDSGTDLRVPLRKDEMAINGFDLGYVDDTWEGVRRIVFPDSVTALGLEAVVCGHLSELRFPERLEYLSFEAFYLVTIDRLVIPAECTLPVWKGFYLCTIGSIKVEEGNPMYSSKDGVLFSADGTVLLWYPDGKKDLHYDVPAGVREIADWAFSSDDMSIPLQTISLPMGLKKIGQYAFCGCGRLHSLTVPLTVTELSENAFVDCVSLERLSLPPGLEVLKNSRWAEYADLTWFNGDNGTTKVRPGSEN